MDKKRGHDMDVLYWVYVGASTDLHESSASGMMSRG